MTSSGSGHPLRFQISPQVMQKSHNLQGFLTVGVENVMSSIFIEHRWIYFVGGVPLWLISLVCVLPDNRSPDIIVCTKDISATYIYDHTLGSGIHIFIDI